MFRADVGGFDVGDHFCWNALAAYNFETYVGTRITYTGMRGYRALSVNYEQGSGRTKYAYAVVRHGPVMGISVKL